MRYVISRRMNINFVRFHEHNYNVLIGLSQVQGEVQLKGMIKRIQTCSI